MGNAAKKALSVIIRIIVSFAILFFLFKNIDQKSLLKIIKDSDKPLLFISFLIFFCAYILGLIRWNMLLSAVNIRLPLKRLVASFSAGLFFNLFLPSTIGGDFMRGADLSFYTKRPKEVIATLFLNRLSGYIGLVVLAVCAFIFGWKFLRDESVLLSLEIIAAALIIALLALFNKFFYNKINKLLKSPKAGNIRDLITSLHEEIHIFRYKKAVVAKNILLSVCIQAIIPLSFYITALSLGVKINPVYFFIFLPIIAAITLLPVSIGGLGLRDATAIFFFAKAGVAKDMAFAMSLLNFSFILIIGVLGGLIYVLTVYNRRV
ncbi:MAG: flippase-like domain-containing protein [Candidatus Omnitrophica bacterium]|nr:flippase-like domain-containing protein [Candidatus Omnitrophota bacterium]